MYMINKILKISFIDNFATSNQKYFYDYSKSHILIEKIYH